MSGIFKSSNSTSIPAFAFGFGAARITAAVPDGVVLRDRDRPILSVAVERGKLVVSATFISASGEILAEIDRNHWILNPGSFFQRNFTDDALEVIDTKGNVVLQLLLVDGTVFLQGVLRCRSGRGIEIFGTADGSGLLIGLKPNEEPKEYLPRMCTYPAQDSLNDCPGMARFKRLLAGHRPPGGYLIRGSLNLCLPPMDHKSILADLRALRSEARDTITANMLDAVIRHAELALQPNCWVDDSHLAPGRGALVFNEDMESIKELSGLIEARAGVVSSAKLHEFIDRLLAADGTFAAVAIVNARSSERITEAQSEQRKANAEIDAGRYSSGIAHYKNVWALLAEPGLQ